MGKPVSPAPLAEVFNTQGLTPPVDLSPRLSILEISESHGHAPGISRRRIFRLLMTAAVVRYGLGEAWAQGPGSILPPSFRPPVDTFSTNPRGRPVTIFQGTGKWRKFIYIVGVRHVPADADYKAHLMESALGHKWIMGQEGILRNPLAENEFLSAVYGAHDAGWVLGIEDDFSHSLADALVVYGLHAAGIQSEIEDRELALILLRYFPSQSPVTNKVWTKLAAELNAPATRQVYSNINRFLSTLPGGLPAIKVMNRARPQLRALGSPRDWMYLFKAIAMILIEDAKKHPASERPNMDVLIRYLSDPTDTTNMNNFFDEINTRWRNESIARRMKEVIQAAIIKDVDVCIPIGGDHVKGISELLEKNLVGIATKIVSTALLEQRMLDTLAHHIPWRSISA